MRSLVLIAALSLGACATVPQSLSDGIQPLGPNTFSISQRNVPFGSPVERAASFCGSFGQQVEIEGNSTEQTVWSDQVHSVLVFSCEDVSPL